MAGEDLQFRDRAVDSASSPESINRIAPIAPPRLWLLVVGISTVIAAFIAWGIFGRVPITVRGTGILIEGTMVVAAESPGDGRIQEVRAKPGDMVTQGDVIAVVASPALETQFADAQAAAARLREQDVAMTATEETAIAAAVAALDAREQECRRRIERASMTAAEFSKAIETKRDLVRQGLLAEADLLGSINTQLEIERSLSEARNEEQRVAADRIDVAIRHRQERQRRGNAVADADAAVRQLNARMSSERNVIAPRSGKVVQVGRGTGDVVRRGSSVAVVSDAGDGRLRCYAFFPLSEGKRVRAEMPTRVEPSVADRERYGSIRGSVRDIEPVVGTSESLLRIINSPEMAQDIQRRYGGIVSAVIDLETDPATASGLRWSGRGNYPRPLTAGTLCEVDVVTEDVSPITLLLPWIKQAFGD